jgi:hypothetical protein
VRWRGGHDESESFWAFTSSLRGGEWYSSGRRSSYVLNWTICTDL